jgi:histidinol-phosphatase (PHP family)
MRGADLHVHSTCSADGASSIAEYARQAEHLALAEVGFCEHVDFDPRDSACGTLDLVRYDREVAQARAAVPGVGLRQGVEITFQAGLATEIGAWLAARRWDYVVASVHLVDYADGWAIISDPAASAYFRTHGQRQAYLPYFDEVLRAVQSGLGDVLGHLDLVKRYGSTVYGPFDPAAFEEEIRTVLRAMVDRGMALEVNTSGLRQGPAELYPAPAVLRWYREMGGERVTLGSDAHDARDLGAGLAEGIALIRAVGFEGCG